MNLLESMCESWVTYLNDLWQFACSRKLCKNNVIANIHKKSTLPKVEKVHYPKITDLEIFKELIDAVYNYHGHYSTKNALKFVLHLPQAIYFWKYHNFLSNERNKAPWAIDVKRIAV